MSEESPELQRLNKRLAVLIRQRLRYDRTPPFIQQQHAKTIATLDKSIVQLKKQQEDLRGRLL